MKKSFLAHRKQSGTFAVEFAVLAFGLVFFIAFCGDVVMRLSTHGKLDRIAYSSVSVIRERTALFSGVDMTAADSAQFNDLWGIAQNSLQRVMGSGYDADKYGMVLEVLTFDNAGVAQPLVTFTDAVDSNCQVDSALGALIAGSATSLYRVTLCYETDNWFGSLVGKNYGLVRSNALSVGR